MRSKRCSEDEFSLILDNIDGLDNRLAVMVAAETGLRIDDVLSLPASVVNKSVLITEKKRGVQRLITLSPELRQELRQRGCANLWLFPGRFTGHRHRSTVFKAMKKACERCHIEGFSPHSLRKLYARRLFEECNSIESVRAALGHKYISTTAIYLFL